MIKLCFPFDKFPMMNSFKSFTQLQQWFSWFPSYFPFLWNKRKEKIVVLHMITLYLRPPRYSWNIVESDVKHHQTNKLYLSFLWWIILEIIHNVTNYKRNAIKLVSKSLKGVMTGVMTSSLDFWFKYNSL
jgi:hypothetical protein